MSRWGRVSKRRRIWLALASAYLVAALWGIGPAIGSEPTQEREESSLPANLVTSSTLKDGRKVVDIDLSAIEVPRETVLALRKYPNLRRLHIGSSVDDDARNEDGWGNWTIWRRPPFRDPFTDERVTLLADFRELELLDLSGTAVTDKGLGVFARTPRLSALGLASTSVTGKGLQALRQLPTLDTIDLRNSPLDKEGINALSQLPSLRILMIGGEKIENDVVELIPKKLPRLRILRLQESNADDNALRHFATMLELEELRLNGSKWITEAGVKHLVDLKTLKRLELEFTGVGDEVVDHLQAMPNLEIVKLGFARVSQQAVDRLRTKRPKLKVEWTPAKRRTNVRPPELSSISKP
jgi:hypothetical protein